MSGLSDEVKKISVDDVFEMSFCESERFELIDGELVAMAPSGAAHESVVSRLAMIFGNFFEGSKCTVYGSNLAVQLDEFSFLMPDLSVVCDQSKIVKERCFGGPELVVEVLSRSTRAYDLGEKKDFYRDCGVKEFWSVDLTKKCVRIENFEFGSVNEFVLGDVAASVQFRGLEVEVARVFG